MGPLRLKHMFYLGRSYARRTSSSPCERDWMPSMNLRTIPFMYSDHSTDSQRLCCVLTFWPGQKCHSGWCTGGGWHILMAVMRGNNVGGNWLIKWDEQKKFPWYTHRLMHSKRVTYELHDSYFHLMTIKHSISKIEWASNDYIIQLSSTSQLNWVPVPVEFDAQGASGVDSRVLDSWREMW